MDVSAFVSYRDRLVSACSKAIVGKKREITLIAVCHVCGGHVLLEDVPGTGKTMLFRAFAKAQGIMDVVRFEREMPHERLADFYRSLDLFVLPSSNESFCCVYAEALACGVPVMGCRGIGFLDELLTEADKQKWLVPPHDAAALADRILKWWKNAERGKVPALTADLNIDHLIDRWLNFVQTAAR